MVVKQWQYGSVSGTAVQSSLKNMEVKYNALLDAENLARTEHQSPEEDLEALEEYELD